MQIPQHFVCSALSQAGSPLCAQPSGNTRQHPAAPVESLSGWKGSLYICMLWHSPLSSGSSSNTGGWDVFQSPACQLETLDRVLAHLLSRFRGNVNNGAYLFLQSWVVLSALGEFSWFPCLLYEVTRPFVYCAQAIQLSFRKKCSKYKCIFDVFL